MKKRHAAESPYSRPGLQGQMYALRLSGFWGTLITIAALRLILPLEMAFFLFFVFGLVVVAVIGSGLAWWYGKKLRGMHAAAEEVVIELSAAEYHALKEPEVTHAQTRPAPVWALALT